MSAHNLAVAAAADAGRTAVEPDTPGMRREPVDPVRSGRRRNDVYSTCSHDVVVRVSRVGLENAVRRISNLLNRSRVDRWNL